MSVYGITSKGICNHNFRTLQQSSQESPTNEPGLIQPAADFINAAADKVEAESKPVPCFHELITVLPGDEKRCQACAKQFGGKMAAYDANRLPVVVAGSVNGVPAVKSWGDGHL
jgi:hypothetical protein